MNSPAIKQNADSWSSLFAAHLATVVARSTDALASTGYDALLIHAGTPPLILPLHIGIKFSPQITSLVLSSVSP